MFFSRAHEKTTKRIKKMSAVVIFAIVALIVIDYYKDKNKCGCESQNTKTTCINNIDKRRTQDTETDADADTVKKIYGKVIKHEV